jgi:hypothetical protein
MTRRYYIHDCEYAGINEIRAGVREATRLKKNLYSNVIPFKTETINAPPLPQKEAAPKPEARRWKEQSFSKAKHVQRGTGIFH